MATYFCAECQHESDERACPLCGEKADQLDVKDDPLMGSVPEPVYGAGRDDEMY
ncbi:hypothetical protein HY374_01455 [Candidatus Berkelbacteria bacterium]|nr:hypothetical protein [Candidatus Berkelbacteria bacterium]